MATVTQRATLDDLYGVEGKAELIGGKIVVEEMATGFRPGEVSGNIYFSLRHHGRKTKSGFATPDNVGYGVPELPSGRESFNPDAAYFTGSLPKDLMRFILGPPTLAVEVRSESNYGEFAEEQLAFKREEYFLAGTLVVWDVDPVAETVTAYRASDPTIPQIWHRGDTADAEPAVPGWRITLDEIFATDVP